MVNTTLICLLIALVVSQNVVCGFWFFRWPQAVQTNIKPCRVDTCGTCSSSAIARNALRDNTGVKDACCPACEPLTGQISSQNSGTATATCTLGCGVTSYTGSFFTPFGFYFDEESGDLVDTADPDADVPQ